MPTRKPIPPIEERARPTLIQKRPGKWTVRFRWRGQTKDRFCGITVEPSEEPPAVVEEHVFKEFTRRYLSGQWSPFEENLSGAAPDRLAAPKRGPTVAEATPPFLDRYDPKTRKNYESVLRLFEASLAPHTLVAEVTSVDVKSFVYRKRVLRKSADREVSRATQRHAWRHLRTFFNWCIKRQFIEVNPVELVDAPRVDERSKPFVPPEQIRKALEVCTGSLPEAFTGAIQICLGCGLRRDEVRHLQVHDVDLQLGSLTIRTKKVKQAEGGVFRPKGRRDRHVPLNPLARMALEQTMSRVESSDDLLFSIGGEILDEWRLTKAWKGIVEDQGIYLPRPLHSLRGLFVTYNLLLGWPVPVVQKMAGHRDSQTTMKYWHDAPGLLFGDARYRFREEAVALGFEPYDVPPIREVERRDLGTPRVRPNADEAGSEPTGAKR